MPEAISFEAKFYALRKSKDGLIVSFVIHPNDAPNELITAPIGEQYVVALAPYVESPSVEATTRKDEGSQLRPIEGVLTPKERYAGLKKEEQAVARAAMLCGDPAFQEWISYGDVGPNRHHMEPEEYARHRLCARLGIVTRKAIADSPMVLDAFLSLETEYLMATGRIASPS